jgi:hypothetical protein
VFPTAPVKPFTECDVKFLDRTDFHTAALEGIMVVREEDSDRNSPYKRRARIRGHSYVISLLYDMPTANIPVQSMGQKWTW